MNATKEQLKQCIINDYGDDDGVVYLDVPERFSDLFKNSEFDFVYVHDTALYNDNSGDIIGYSGVFNWSCNKIESLDGDSYDDEWLDVVAFQRWENENKKCIDIYVKRW